MPPPLALSPAASASSSVKSSSGDVRFAAYPAFLCVIDPGLNRCGKSCRLRWLNYLRPDIKHGGYTEQGLVCFDAPQSMTKQTELAPVPTTTLVTGGGAWASSTAASGAVAELEDDMFLSGLVGGGEQLFPYVRRLLRRDDAGQGTRALGVRLPAEIWGAAASDAMERTAWGRKKTEKNKK
ncbi:hypothetical protein HU200_018697 [Digitaria exilis]|uniref:HTH myb-type domain-containing protein n=1 Tax=Digitaria exilis TaxID=1010633 RepID=A0A835F4L0_9POAL|nr:hypothetical protein HU200_018697 [Digitaria exilis]